MAKKNILHEIFELIPLLFKMKFIKCSSGEKISFGDENNQYYILKTPKQITKKTLTVYIHGGSFKHSSASSHNFVGDTFTKEGFINVNICYRKVPDFIYPAAIEDTFEGLAHSISELEKRNIVIEDIIISGSSAGAYLGAMICFNKDLQKKYKLDKYNFKGFCSLSGLINIDYKEKNNKYYKSIIDNFFGNVRDNTLDYINNVSDLSLLVIHSIDDPIVDYSETKIFYDSYKGNKELYIGTDVLHCMACISAFKPDRDEHSIFTKWLSKFS